MKKFKHLHLHIGLPKCASTFLQAFFRLNQRPLLSHGVSYPILKDMEHQGNLAVVNYMYPEEGPPEWFATINARYATRIDPIKHYHEEIETQMTTDVALLSNELLVKRPVDYLDFIFDRFEQVTVHVVFRPKPLLLESHYLQNVQQGHYKHDINEIFTHPASVHRIENTLRYARYYKKWVGKVGEENVRVHFLSAGHPPIHEQLCRAMGLEDFSSFLFLSLKMKP